MRAFAPSCFTEGLGFFNEAKEIEVIEIEKGIPVPTTRQLRNSAMPLEKMEIGDLFALPVTEEQKNHCESYASSIRSRVTQWARKNGAKKFTVLLVEEQSKVMVWRIA